jgi:hypothetical protein
MLDDIGKRNLEEACGLVAGVGQTSLAVYPVTNILHSPVRYRMDPEQQLKYFNLIDENQWHLLAICCRGDLSGSDLSNLVSYKRRMGLSRIPD